MYMSCIPHSFRGVQVKASASLAARGGYRYRYVSSASPALGESTSGMSRTVLPADPLSTITTMLHRIGL